MAGDGRQAELEVGSGGVWRRFRRRRGGVFGFAAVVLLGGVGFFAPVLASDDPIVCRYEGRWHFPAVVDVVHQIPFARFVVGKSAPFRLAGFDAKAALDGGAFALWPVIPFGPLETSEPGFSPPSGEHWLGTDEVGRDVAARLVHGAAVAVQVGVVSMGIAALLGLVVGGLAGYFGGWVDLLFSRVMEVVICFPVFFLVISVMVWLEPSIVNVMVVIGLTRWTSVARYTRGEFLRNKELDFVTAARACGAGHFRVMVVHLLPNSLAPVFVTVTFGVAHAILIEAGLSWLGFGVQPPAASWGVMLRSAYEHMSVGPHLVYPPCVAIFVSVLVLNLLGDGLRDATDPEMEPGVR